MNNYIKRVLSVVMCIVVVFCMAAPLSISASPETAVEPETEVSAKVEGIEMSKSYDAKAGVLTLETYLTGESVTTITQEIDSDLDIMLVLDATSSMEQSSCSIATSMEQLNRLRTEKEYYDEYSYDGYSVRYEGGKWQYKKSGSWRDITEVSSSKKVTATLIVALKVAASAFVNTVSETSEKIRIGVVKFGYLSKLGALFSSESSGDKTTLIRGLTECTNSSGKNQIIDAIDTIGADYDTTNPSSGLTLGMGSFSSDTSRKKVMILFTDGEPNGSDSQNDCVSAAHTAKQSGITIYTVGIFDDGVERPFLNYVSSKYPNAKSKSNTGTPVEGQYYFNATESQNLDSIFQTIAKEAVIGGATVTTLHEGTTLRDIISDSFILDDSGDKKIHVYTCDYTGVGSNPWGSRTEIEIGDRTGIYVNYDPLTKTADVTGFDYSANWCGKRIAADGSVTYGGKKLVVTIPIKSEDGVQGATGINTNDPGSGIIPENSDKPIGNYPVPTTDIPTAIPITKVFAGYTPQDVQFAVEATVSAHITGYEDPDENDYTKAITESKIYSNIVLNKTNPTYTGIQDILIAAENRPSTITVTEKSVPVGYKVTISDGTNSYDFTSNGGDVSQTFTVIPDMAITITNNKLNPDVAKVTLKNTVSGSYGDKNMDFEFVGSYMSGNVEQELSEALKHGGSKDIENVDYGSTFIVSAKNSDGYLTTVSVNGEPIEPENGVYKITVSGDTVVEFNHDKDGGFDVGINMDCLPWILIVGFVAAGATGLIVKKKKAYYD